MIGISTKNSAKVFAAVIVAGALFFAAPGFARGQNIFVKVTGINGESTDPLHRDWIEALGYFDAITVSGASGTTSGARTARRATFNDVKILKSIDKASPLLRRTAAESAVLKEVKIEFTRETDGAKFLEITLENVTIAEITGAVSKLSDDAQETVALNFRKIQYVYTEYDPSGKAKGTVSFGWDTVAGKRI